MSTYLNRKKVHNASSCWLRKNSLRACSNFRVHVNHKEKLELPTLNPSHEEKWPLALPQRTQRDRKRMLGPYGARNNKSTNVENLKQ